MELTGAEAEPDRELRRAAVRVLARNWHGHATVPSPGLYPHQWSWDSAFIAFGLQHWAPARGAAELLSLFGGQWRDGRVPHIVFNPAVPEDAYFPGPRFWRSGSVPGSGPAATSGLIQPPVHAVAALALMTRLPDPDSFARRIYPLLCAQHAYLADRRAVPETGLVAIWHPWESGMDNSPAWDAPLAAVPADPALLEHHTRRDLEHAGDDERPTDEDYSRYIRLAAAYREHGYDDGWALAEAEFAVMDPLFNAVWSWAELALAEMADRLGLSGERHRAEATRITAALVRELYADDAGLALASDLRAGEMVPELTVAGAMPLLAPGLPAEVVAGIVRTLTGRAFRADSPEVLGVPSCALTSSTYDPRRYWRGPSWMNTTWLVAEGLRTAGQPELADKLDGDLLRLAGRSGFREYFNPRTGEGHGTNSFSWSAAIVLHLLAGR